MTRVAEWKRIVRERLADYGHRNWIVIVDAAYPAQTAGGIETLRADCDLPTALSFVLAEVDAAGHIQANILTDLELKFVRDEDAPGVSECRRNLEQQLGHRQHNEVLHEEIIARLDQAARLFRVLIVKTAESIPYTSVFLELECGYWNAKAEENLRRAMAIAGPNR